jgi:hypothetical protein
MQEYSTALLQIVSTTLSAEELEQGLMLPNAARQQPPPPHSYFGFESKALCSSHDINAHIDIILSKLSQKKAFLKERKIAGDEISLLWFADPAQAPFSLLTPNSMQALAEYKIPLLIKNTEAS